MWVRGLLLSYDLGTLTHTFSPLYCNSCCKLWAFMLGKHNWTATRCGVPCLNQFKTPESSKAKPYVLVCDANLVGRWNTNILPHVSLVPPRMLNLSNSRAMLNLLLLCHPCTPNFLSMKMCKYIQVGNELGQSNTVSSCPTFYLLSLKWSIYPSV